MLGTSERMYQSSIPILNHGKAYVSAMKKNKMYLFLGALNASVMHKKMQRTTRNV